jgi:hypothetical protein
MGRELAAHNVRRDLRTILDAAGLTGKDWTPRELRQSFVSLLSDAGVRVVAQLVTRRHNQAAADGRFGWWAQLGSNQGPLACKIRPPCRISWLTWHITVCVVCQSGGLSGVAVVSLVVSARTVPIPSIGAAGILGKSRCQAVRA